LSTPSQRQREREEKAIDDYIAAMRSRSPSTALEMDRLDALKGEGFSRDQIIAVMRAKQRINAPRPPASPEQLAVVSRHLETIVAAETVNPATGEISSVEKTKRAVSLVDMMQKENLLSMDLHQAAEEFRRLFNVAMGSSKGVSSYGDYVAASEPSKRLPTSTQQMQAYEQLKQACVAAFGVLRQDKRWTLDEQLMQLVVPAILSDKKEITQGSIGQQRTGYTGSAQIRSAGGTVVFEVLQRLSRHFHYREDSARKER
jgi:hypothetical protein